MKRSICGPVLAVALIASGFLDIFAVVPVRADVRALHIGLIEQPNSLDPLHATEFYENYIEEAIFSGLVVIDDRGNPSPDLAERVPTSANGGISRDGRTLTYHLRHGVRWQDGIPLTSRDVAYTFARMMQSSSNFSQTTTYAAIERIDTPDDTTVVVHLKAPWADATSQLFVNGENGSILPKHILQKEPDLARAPFESAPIGCGPYRVQQWDRGTRVTLAANETYFRGKPKIARIDFDFIPDQTTLGVRLQTGELDFSPQLPSTIAIQLRSLPRMRFQSVPTYVLLQLDFNTTSPIFRDERVRAALALALDRARVVKTAYHGLAIPADDLVPQQSAFYTHDPSVSDESNAGKAAALLDAAGWRVAADGLRHKNGQVLASALVVPIGNEVIGVAALELQSAWHALGVDASIRPLQTTVMYSPDGPLARGDFDVSLTTFGYATSPDRSPNFTSGAIAPNGFNYSRVTDAALDREIFAARAQSDPIRRRASYAEISATVRHRAILVPIVWQEDGYLYNAHLAGLRPEPVNSDLWNVYDWQWR